MKRIFASLALALALTGVVATSGANADELGVCEGSPEVLGHEWQPQSRTREKVTEYRMAKFVRTKSKTYTKPVAEVKAKHYSWTGKKRDADNPPSVTPPHKDWQANTSHEPHGDEATWVNEYLHYTANSRGHASWFYFTPAIPGVPGGWSEWSDFGDWSKWLPEQHVQWRSAPDPIGSPQKHAEWQEGNTKFYREWQVRHDGQTRQVHTPWTDWADTGDVVRTDEQTEPELPADTDVIEHRWVYVGTYVKVEATAPAWQDTDPEAPCFNGPERPEDDYFKDQGEYLTCEGLFRWVELFGIPYVWDGDAWVPGEPVSLEHLEDKVRDLTLQERFEQGCVPDRPEEPRNPDPTPEPEPTPTPDPTPTPTDPPTEEPTPEPKPRDELAETGIDAWLVGLVASLMVAAGIIIKRLSARY